MDGTAKGVLAVILAGGRGRRMDILCDERAKPALPVGGNRRVIDFVLNNCFDSQIASIAALTDYRSAQLAEYLKTWGFANGNSALSILPPHSGNYAGTADAVFQNLDYIQSENAESVLILAGDHIYRMDYREMHAYHKAAGADLTVGVVQVPKETASRFGTLKVDAEGRITEFVEKSSQPVSDLASMGIYVFKPALLAERLSQDAANPNSPHDFGYAILPKMVREDRVFAFQFKDYWRDIGTVSSYYEANMELLQRRNSASLTGCSSAFESVQGVLLSDVQRGVVNSLVSPRCSIQGLVQNSILSPGVFVGERTIIRNSIIMSDCEIGSGCIIANCILDERVRVAQGCHIGAGRRPQDISIIGMDVNIPPFSIIQAGSRVAGNGRSSFLQAANDNEQPSPPWSDKAQTPDLV